MQPTEQLCHLSLRDKRTILLPSHPRKLTRVLFRRSLVFGNPQAGSGVPCTWQNLGQVRAESTSPRRIDLRNSSFTQNGTVTQTQMFDKGRSLSSFKSEIIFQGFSERFRKTWNGFPYQTRRATQRCRFAGLGPPVVPFYQLF